MCSFSLGFLISHFRGLESLTAHSGMSQGDLSLFAPLHPFVGNSKELPAHSLGLRSFSSRSSRIPTLLPRASFTAQLAWSSLRFLSSAGDISSVLFSCLATAPPLCLFQQKSTAKSKQDEIMEVFLGQSAMPGSSLLLRSLSIPGGSAFSSSCLAHSSLLARRKLLW